MSQYIYVSRPLPTLSNPLSKSKSSGSSSSSATASSSKPPKPGNKRKSALDEIMQVSGKVICMVVDACTCSVWIMYSKSEIMGERGETCIVVNFVS